MRQFALRAALAALAVAIVLAAPAQARGYDERPMRLPASGGPGVAAASAQPSTWLVAAEPGDGARARAIARRFGARTLRSGAVYRVATRAGAGVCGGAARRGRAALRRARCAADAPERVRC